MSYEAKTWSAGDTVTSAHLNRMEQGIANAGSTVIHASDNSGYLVMDKTWQEIYDAMMNGACIVEERSTYNRISLIRQVCQDTNNDKYYVYVSNGVSGGMQYSCSSPNDYPKYAMVS